MALLTLLTLTLGLATTALALPQNLPLPPPPSAPLVPSATNITLHALPHCACSATSATSKKATDTEMTLEVDANTCTPLCAPSVSIPQVEGRGCLLGAWYRSATCAMVEGDGGEKVTYVLGQGTGELCVDLEIEEGECEDGGKASAVWSCG
ncbi:uncharacterized protein LTR77_008036 [Saxophila tyrrhenica]|uniref:Uncharacterized protein n=1 Tax=Saxophila tyrrhenica TaxID=1690608 RepID=A0AAV9P4M1_9PEZI|nr:hypothetical protein LTR77_008036 [Saxophila tyrrhenica]